MIKNMKNLLKKILIKMYQVNFLSEKKVQQLQKKDL